MRSALVGLIGFVLVLAWLFFLSRMPLARRLKTGFVGLLVLASLSVTLRIAGVSGDLVPIFEWRWTDRSIDQVEPSRSLPPTAAENPVPGLANFPQFFGPDRTGKLAGPKLARDWDVQAPAQVWRREIGSGWCGFAVAGRRAISHEQHGDEEAVVCYDVLTGDVLWVHRDPALFTHPVAGIGPRATPTVDGKRVLTLGATGILNCLALATGKRIWSKNILKDNGAKQPEWGVAGSPLIVDDFVVISAGGKDGRSLVAYDKKTGKRVWAGGSDRAQWSSPLRANLVGRDQVLMFNAHEVTSHDAKNGVVLWSYPWRGEHPHVCLPVVCPDDRVLISSGYGTGCQLVQVERTDQGGFKTSRVWRSLAMKAKFTNIVVHSGHIYGLDDGILACVDLTNGRRKWKRGRYGHGQILLVGGLLLVTAENGEVVLLEPVPDEPRELTRFRAFDHKTWNPPAVAGRYLLVRTDREAACFELPVDGK